MEFSTPLSRTKFAVIFVGLALNVQCDQGGKKTKVMALERGTYCIKTVHTSFLCYPIIS